MLFAQPFSTESAASAGVGSAGLRLDQVDRPTHQRVGIDLRRLLQRCGSLRRAARPPTPSFSAAGSRATRPPATFCQACDGSARW